MLGTFCLPGTFSPKVAVNDKKIRKFLQIKSETECKKRKKTANGGYFCKNDGKRQEMAKNFVFSQAHWHIGCQALNFFLSSGNIPRAINYVWLVSGLKYLYHPDL